MKKITKDMLDIYKPMSNLDWMNYKINKQDMTFHHIKRRCDGGKEEINNGALLMKESHQYLHIIEFKDYEIYVVLNKIFEYINKQKKEPKREQREIIEYLLKQFEKEHSEDKNSKGKELIKENYKKRSAF